MYKFNAFITTTNGDTTATQIVSYLAKSKVEAYQWAEQEYPNASIRVYTATTTLNGKPNAVGIAIEANDVVRAVSSRLVEQVQQDWRWDIYKGVRRGSIKNYKEHLGNSPQVVNEVDFDGLSRDEQIVAEQLLDTSYLPDDAQDLVSVARCAIAQAIAQGKNSQGIRSAAFTAVNAYIDQWRAIVDSTTPLDYFVETEDGEVVNIRKDINKLFTEQFAYSQENMQEVAKQGKRARLRTAVKLAIANLTSTRRDIAKLLALGYSQRGIAEKMGRNVATVNGHIAVIRQTIVDTFETYGFGDLLPKGVDLAKVKKQAHNANAKYADRK